MKAFLLALVIFPVALLAHEGMHLVVLVGLGGHGDLIIRSWQLALADASLPAFHVTGGDALDPGRHLLFEFGGPALAAVPLAILAWQARPGAVRSALVANVAILAFFALLEPAYELLERGFTPPAFLIWPEFNYGVPLLLMLVFALRLRRARA